MSKQPPPAPTASAIGPCPTSMTGSLGHWKGDKMTHSVPGVFNNGIVLLIWLVGCFGF